MEMERFPEDEPADIASAAAEVVPAVQRLGEYILLFAQTDRATNLSSTGERESDTDHTVMLAVIAPALASRFLPDLDASKVNVLATVHDLVEGYAQDTSTLNADAAMLQDKAAREAAALERLKTEFSATFPWLTDMIEEYETGATAEARFVRIIDKIMPTIANIHDGGRALREFGVTSNQAIEASAARTTERLQSFAGGQEFAMALRRAMLDYAKKRLGFPEVDEV